MTTVEFDGIMAPYEFEDRGHLFMAEVIELSKNFPKLFVEAENKTISDLEANSWAIEKSATLKKGKLNQRAFLRGYEMDIKSADETVIIVTIHGTLKKHIRTFIDEADKIAKAFRGVKMKDNDSSIPDIPEDEFRYFTYVTYIFSEAS
ncbi:MAG: hypothetical protein HYV90_00380 [Candidatus Woesebacteria bacterium]|nr:MAG: hypothetical protein HYV90_00380 [Candidatus Woesebacteria bacterium]